jgi:uncharacterized membrane protein YfcA
MVFLEYFPVAFIAFILGIGDASTGMGYGTILTPLLLIAGYDPLQVVPAVLISQLAGNFLAAFLHHNYRNVDFSRGSRDFKVAMALSLCSIIGSIIAVVVASNLSKLFINLYIGVLFIVTGLIVVVTKKNDYGFSWTRLLGFGSLAAFNKGISGGGYGPLVTAGQVLSGVKAKKIIGIISLTEGITCIFAVLMYVLLGSSIDWTLSILLSIGVIFSAPIAAFIVKRIENKRLMLIIGIYTLLLGLFTILRTF